MDEIILRENLSEGYRPPRPFLRIAIALILWLPVIAWYIIRPGSETVENFYSLGFYRHLMPVVTFVTGNMNFSVFPILFIVLILIFVIFWIRNWVFIIKKEKRSHGKAFLWGISRFFLFILPGIWLWFMIFWGFGYFRMSIEERLLLPEEEISAEEFILVADALLQIINEEQPLSDNERDVERALQSAAVSMMKIVKKWDGKPVKIPEKVKLTRPGALLIDGTSGICMPFTLEPYVDGGLPDTAMVKVGIHELGHLTGLGDEGETNMIAYVAGILAEDSYARYASALGLYENIAMLRGEDAYKLALTLLPEQAQDDIRRREEAHNYYSVPWIKDLSWRIYNVYLKLQGVEEGVLSYERGAGLFVQALKAGHLNQRNDCPLLNPFSSF